MFVFVAFSRLSARLNLFPVNWGLKFDRFGFEVAWSSILRDQFKLRILLEFGHLSTYPIAICQQGNTAMPRSSETCLGV